MATIQQSRPNWYTRDDDNAWERVKEAFRRDWQQTKHDFGAHQPDLNQNVGDTISQAAGSTPAPPANVPNPSHDFDDDHQDAYDERDDAAYRYGFAAYRHHGPHAEWTTAIEATLRKDWGDDAAWVRHRNAIRRGWNFAKAQQPPY